MLFYPPAVSNIYFCTSIKSYIYSKDNPNSKDNNIIYANSWVLLLKVLLQELEKRYHKQEVLLGGHSCYEFTKAIELAGLKPVYHDFDRNFKIPMECLDDLISNNTLAFIGIHNVGLDQENLKLKELCLRRNVIYIEDSTYTFLGYSQINNNKFSTFGDYAILNFSEGKIIPVGGGALVLNTDKDKVKTSILEVIKTPTRNQNFKDLIKILIYLIGSHPISYTFYKFIEKILSVDLKRINSMEFTRKTNYMDHFSLKESGLKSISEISQNVINTIILKKQNDINNRYKKYLIIKSLLEKKGYRVFQYHETNMILRIPFIIPEGKQKNLSLQKLNFFGIRKLYGDQSPLIQKTNIVSKEFYQTLFTFPVHKFISISRAKYLINKFL